MRFPIVMWAAAVGLVLSPMSGRAAGEEKGKQGKQNFHLSMPHTEEQRLAALDQMAAKNAKLLEKTEWGWKAGDHTGHVTVAAPNEQAAPAMVPGPQRANAKAHPVTKFTAKDLAAIHKQMAGKK